MTYRIAGLDPARFAYAEGLIAAGARRVVADGAGGFPCRVSLEDARPGEALLLLNFVSADADTPFRASHAIFVREGAMASPVHVDRVPPMIDRRMVGLRAFDAAGMMRDARLAGPGEADDGLRALMADGTTNHVDIHNAAWGCFLARAERSDGRD